MKRNNPTTEQARKVNREEFVKICYEAILKTREDIAIANQKSGYIKYHNAIKNENYFQKFRIHQTVH